MVLVAEEDMGEEGYLVLVTKELKYQVSGSQVSNGEAMLQSLGVVLNLGCTGIIWEILK